VTLFYRIERLDAHDRSGFDCGVPALNIYLQKQAGQEVRRRVTACYLLIEQATSEIAGYYTLSAGSVLLSDLPEASANQLPRYPSVPVIRIGRLAVDRRYQGHSLGSVLIYDALKRAATGEIGVYAIVVDAKDDVAVAFYERHGFVAFESAPRMLYLSISDGLKKLSGTDP
jgi:GNAT superfamily N-acetyltransferase